MLKKIEVRGLFDKFDYQIELKEEGITILTGPNGYGKTTILKIIYAFAIKNVAFFFQLPFEEIILTQETDEIKLLKKEDTIVIQWGDGNPKTIARENIISQRELGRLVRNPRYRQIDENHWIDRSNDAIYTTESFINQLVENDPELQAKLATGLPDFLDVYLIREQRLISKSTVNKRNRPSPYYFDEEKQGSFAHTIEEYALELSKQIKDVLANASKIGQELDSSFPRRLFDEANRVSEQQFNDRYNVIKAKQKSLSSYHLSATEEESHTSFKEVHATALLVYLHDSEKKLAVFDELLKKLELFSTILNAREFVFKKLEISPDFGFRFETAEGKELSLTDLSSGEQQQVVLLYELIFKACPHTLVLIDEPEISLHVAWQKEFLTDLLKIIELQQITVITATHSPQIIGKYWDLVVDLGEIAA